MTEEIEALNKRRELQQTVGGFAALYLAAAYLLAMPYFLVFVKYQSAADSAEKVTLLLRHNASMRVVYLITYIVFGFVLILLALALHARLKERAPTLARVATSAGLMWGFLLAASGLVFNAGVDAVVGGYDSNPATAIMIWQAIEPVALGLGGSGGELFGGLWVLLVSIAASHTAVLPRALNWLGVATGVAGVLSVVPVLRDLAYGFGLMQIPWFVCLGTVMLRRQTGAVGFEPTTS
jgi:Domain of unknown function (DUF4386)